MYQTNMCVFFILTIHINILIDADYKTKTKTITIAFSQNSCLKVNTLNNEVSENKYNVTNLYKTVCFNSASETATIDKHKQIGVFVVKNRFNLV